MSLLRSLKNCGLSASSWKRKAKGPVHHRVAAPQQKPRTDPLSPALPSAPHGRSSRVSCAFKRRTTLVVLTFTDRCTSRCSPLGWHIQNASQIIPSEVRKIVFEPELSSLPVNVIPWEIFLESNFMLSTEAHIEKNSSKCPGVPIWKDSAPLTWKLLYLYSVPPVYMVTRPMEATSTYWFGKRNKFTQQPLATHSRAKAS